MGIPFYFRKVATKFPHVLSASPGATPRFFIDFNGIIHTCAGVLKADGGIRREDFEAALLDKICETVAALLGIVSPSFLFMSIDGMPSMAKIQQQRRRRYCSALEAAGSDCLWDSNAISPGTPFMERLATRLREWAKTIKNTTIILSDSQEPGEGEHKIIQYIRRNPSAGASTSDMIYGLDADLIMLAVLESTPIYIMRETQVPKNPKKNKSQTPHHPYTYIDVTLFRSLLRSHLEMFDMRGPLAIHIYVFMCFFIGNDFVPSLSYLKLQDDGLEVILQAYRIVKAAIDEEPITADFSINHHFLWRWMEVLQKTEDAAFIAAHASYVETQRPAILKSLPPGAAVAARYLDTPKISTNAWRIDYYHYLFDSSADSPCIHKACTQYMEGLQWLVDLYFNQTIHAPGWYYYYAYSPSALDLYNYLTTQMAHLPKAHTLLKAKYLHNEIPVGDTDTLLLAILPPVSILQCIPKLAPVMLEPANGVAHLFPRTFKLQSYLRRHAWESYPQLPLLDIPALLKAKQNTLK